jgi:hypothetical protein
VRLKVPLGVSANRWSRLPSTAVNVTRPSVYDVKGLLGRLSKSITVAPAVAPDHAPTKPHTATIRNIFFIR